MLQRINNTEDIIDVITGDVSKIIHIRYFTHTDPSNYIQPNDTYEGTDVLKCRLESSELQKLPSGQLMCEVHLAKEDDEFNDGEYNTIVRKAFNIWLNGTDSGGGGTTPVITTDTINLGDDVTIKAEQDELHMYASGGVYFDGDGNDCYFENTIVNFDDDIYVNGVVYSDNKECLTEIPDEIEKEITTDGLVINEGHDITVNNGSITVNSEDGITIQDGGIITMLSPFIIHYEDGDGNSVNVNWKDLLGVLSSITSIRNYLNALSDRVTALENK